MADQNSHTYSERLWPSATFFIALLLTVPAFTVLLTPFSIQAGLITGIIVYVATCAIFVLASRKVAVHDSTLTAGHASIDVGHLGDIDILDAHDLRIAIGRRLDARAYLCVSGWVHSGIRVQVTDPDDPTPYWVVTTRHPQALADSIRAAKSTRV